MARLTVAGVRHAFGSNPVLRDAFFQLDTGEVLAIFGRNGSGKSTLLKAIFGTLRAEAIQVVIDGRSYARRQIIQRRLIGYLPQHRFLPPGLTVRQVIPYFLPAGKNQDKVFYAPGIFALETRRVGTLSVGEVRYLELLILAQLDHPFLLLDEPFAMVEPQFNDRIRQQIQRIAVHKGLVVTDHYYDSILAVSTRNLLLDNGILVPVRGKSDLIAQGYLPASRS